MVNFNRFSRKSRSAFTVIELLVVIAVIIVLVGLLLAGLRAASGAARDAVTNSRFQAISQALSAFRNDHGYLPPILRGGLEPNRQGPAFNDLVTSPVFSQSNSDYAVEMQSWYSITSLPEFLIGPCGRDVDGYGQVSGDTNSDTERPALGIRSPGADGVWGSSLYYLGNGPAGSALASDRVKSFYVQGSVRFRRPGPVYGPYLGLDQPDFLGKVQSFDAPWSENDPNPEPVRLLTENDQAWADDPCLSSDTSFVLLDGYGKPIEYFRSPYALGDLTRKPDQKWIINTSDPELASQRSTLADIIRLRPFAFASTEADVDAGQDGDGTGAFDSRFVQDFSGDSSTSLELKSAEWAIFSGGADQTYNPWVRAAAVNKDNLVEIGR